MVRLNHSYPDGPSMIRNPFKCPSRVDLLAARDSALLSNSAPHKKSLQKSSKSTPRARLMLIYERGWVRMRRATYSWAAWNMVPNKCIYIYIFPFSAFANRWGNYKLSARECRSGRVSGKTILISNPLQPTLRIRNIYFGMVEHLMKNFWVWKRKLKRIGELYSSFVGYLCKMKSNKWFLTNKYHFRNCQKFKIFFLIIYKPPKIAFL